MTTPVRYAPIVAAGAVLAALMVLPLVGSPFLTTQFVRILIYAVFAMSLDLLIGYCGLVSLGHAAFFGVAAYVTALLASEAGVENILIILPASLAAAALAAAAIGALTLRTTGIYFIMATLAFAQMMYFIVQENTFFGGSDGILLLSRFRLGVGSITLLDLGNRLTLYYLVLASTVLVFIGLWSLVRSPFGRVIQGIRANEQRMRALGYPVARYKFVCFVIAGMLAGLAGHFYVILTSLADPSIVDWLHSVQVLVMLIVGGIGTLVGPAVGALVLIILIDQASEFTEHWKLVVGALVIAVTLFSRGGLVGLMYDLGAPVFNRRPS